MDNPCHQMLTSLAFFLILRLSSAQFSDSPSPSPSSAPAPAPYPFIDYDDDDYMYPPPGPPPPPPAPCNPNDRDTLLRIKQALNNTDLLSSWLPGSDCCNRWEFVGCDETSGNVITLSFYGNGWGRDDLPRILPSAVGDLTSLQNLNFYNNATGPIPTSLGNLKNLSSLYLSHNEFCGPIPSFLSEMQNLGWLEISGNKLTGPIPANLTDAPNLYVIKLNNNMLSGRIPESLGRFKNPNNNVINIDLSDNRLVGPIPQSFGAVNFRSLFLTGNRLVGDASFVFGKEKGVWQIDLSRNKLAFNLSNIGVPPQLSWLGLNNNKIYGGLPPALNNNGMFYLNVSYNHLTGQIPVGSTFQQFDETAYFHNDGLCGAPLPACP